MTSEYFFLNPRNTSILLRKYCSLANFVSTRKWQVTRDHYTHNSITISTLQWLCVVVMVRLVHWW